MRAEDLYKAMEGIDDELILRSEHRIETAREEEEEAARKKKRKAKSSRARFHRYFTIAATTAAAVFMLLMARELAGARGLKSAKSSNLTSGSVTQSQDEQYMAEAAEEAMAEDAQEEAMAEDAQEEAMPETDYESAEDSVQESDSVKSEDAGSAVEAEVPDDENTQDKSLAENAGKTAVDLLGEMADEYVSLEYISAEDEAKGGSRTVPDYTRAGEAALSAAFESGRAEPSFLANKGKPVYYVYLTRKGGEVNKATFYENEYISLDSIPGVVMKISHAEYEAVMQLFR